MSNHFSPRSIAFYGCAIGTVTVLFSVVSAYGEANLKAPTYIGGRYPITSPALPGCLQNQSLVLLVEQSGVFLTGSLVAVNATETVARIAEERPSLTGRWDNQTMVLQGKTPYLPNCAVPISLEGNFDGKALQGKIRLNPSSGDFPFTAARAVPQETQPEGGH